MESVLKLKNVVKYLSWNKILKWINLDVKSWEIYWFLWPNGAWKTTTMKSIMWLIDPEEWTIEVFWEKWLTIEAKKKIGFMPENTYLYKYLTWEEFLRFNAKFFDIPKEKMESKIKELLEKVWLTHAKDRYLNEYSKWMLQRIWLAQAIINEPKLVFLDEPMSGLDPLWRKMVKDFILELKRKWTTVFFNTHVLADAESMCDRISIIHKWEIIVNWEDTKNINWLENYFIEKVTWSDKEAILDIE